MKIVPLPFHWRGTAFHYGEKRHEDHRWWQWRDRCYRTSVTVL